jgi:hypothetical protein
VRRCHRSLPPPAGLVVFVSWRQYLDSGKTEPCWRY